MGLLWTFLRIGIAATILVAVADVSKRQPRLGALLLSLPIVSILALQRTWAWQSDYRDVASWSKIESAYRQELFM